MQPDEILSRALHEPFGLAVQTTSFDEAKSLRRAIYSARDRARSLGDHAFDALSVLLHGSELHIIKRARSQRISTFTAINARSLTAAEVPTSVGARGARRLGLVESLHVLAALESAIDIS